MKLNWEFGKQFSSICCEFFFQSTRIFLSSWIGGKSIIERTAHDQRLIIKEPAIGNCLPLGETLFGASQLTVPK
jgi:hypothetical protein